MILSFNNKATLSSFTDLIAETNKFLNDEAKKKEHYYLTRNGQKLEDDVLNALNICAVGSAFEGTIIKVSGQKFPDIVALNMFGVEVKSSKDDSWSSLGGSVNESTRVDGIEKIFLTFGKLSSPVEFISRPYEECLSEVVVTHYPRYKINMHLGRGETIFDKMNTSYDQLRLSGNSVSEIVKYYKSQLKQGESLWWIDTTDQSSHQAPHQSMNVVLWKHLSVEKKEQLVISGICLFTEIFTNSSDKYERFSLWLATHHGVVATSLRDTFSAGGRVTVTLKNGYYYHVSRFFYNVHLKREKIAHFLNNTSDEVLKEYWQTTEISTCRVSQWLERILQGFHQDSSPPMLPDTKTLRDIAQKLGHNNPPQWRVSNTDTKKELEFLLYTFNEFYL